MLKTYRKYYHITLALLVAAKRNQQNKAKRKLNNEKVVQWEQSKCGKNDKLRSKSMLTHYLLKAYPIYEVRYRFIYFVAIELKW